MVNGADEYSLERDCFPCDDAFIRPAEVDLLVGDASKAENVLGWKCETDFYALVEMMVEADLKAIQR